MEKFCTKCGRYYAAGTESCPECGGRPAGAGLKPGTIVGGFEIIGELGRGSNGIVYRARQIKLDREVALKILPVGKDSDKTYVENFFREARAAARLSHPSIVMAFDAGVSEEGIYFFAMELIDGESLDHRIMTRGPMELKSALRVAHDIAEGLEYAWRTQHLTHGDIKPANIILDPVGGAKIADLGLAKTAGEGYSGELMATPMFAAPEVCNFEFDKIGFKSDMYSYACTVYFMFAGIPPFDESDTEKVMRCHINEQPEPLTGRLPLFPPEISAFIDRMLAKNPDDRPSSWQEVVDFMTAARQRHLAIPLLPPPPRNSGRKKLAILVGLIGALCLLAAAAFILYFGVFRPAAGPEQTTGSAPPVNAIPATEAEEWANFQPRLAELAPEQQLDALQEYLDRGIVDDDVRVQIKTMILNIENERKKKQYEQDPLLKTFLEITAIPRPLDSLPYSDLREIARRLRRLNSEVRLQNSLDADFRNDLCSRIDSVLAQIEPLAADRLAAAAKARLESARADLKASLPQPFPDVRLPPPDPRRESYLQLLLALRKDMPWQEHKLKELNSLLSPPQNPGLHENDAQTLHFLRQQTLKCNKLIPILADNKQLFINNPLPWDRQSDVKVTGIDRRDITVGREVEAGAILRSRVPWTSFSQAQLAELISGWVLAQKPEALTPAEWSDLAGWLFFNGEPELLARLLAQSGTLPEAECNSWTRLLNDFAFAEQEYESALIMNAARNALEKRDYRAARQLLARLHNKKHAPVPEKLDQALRQRCVVVPSEDIYRHAEEEFKHGHFVRALTAACTVIERSSGPDFQSTSGPAAEAMRNDIIARCIASPSRTPEYRQEIFLPPGSAAKWQSGANDAPLNRRPGFGASIRLAAMLDLGQWRPVFDTPEFGGAYLNAIRKLPEGWRSSALYDLGILYRHFGHFREAEETGRLLFEDIRREADRPAVPAMRYAVAVRSYPEALRISQSLLSGNSLHAYRIAVARLLMQIQDSAYGESDFSNEVLNLKNVFSAHNLGEDFKFLDWAASVYANANTPAPFPANLNRCREKELLARLGCDILARDLFLDRRNHAGIRLDALLTPDSTYNYDLWYRYALLSVLREGPLLSSWRKTLAALYADSAIAAIPSYPRLVMLECLGSILAGSDSPAAAGAYFKPVLEVLPMASAGDKAFADILLGDAAQTEKLTRTSVWNTLAAMTLSCLNRGDDPYRFPRELESPFPGGPLLWQERLLLRDFATMLKATGKTAE